MSKAILGAVEIVAGAVLDYFGYVKAGNALISMGLGTELGAVADALIGNGKPPINPIGVAYSGTLEPRRIVYGKVKISGMYVIPPMTSGANNDDFHLILALAGHVVSSIGDVYLDQIRIPSANIGAITGAGTDGVVSGILSPPSGTVNGSAYNNIVHIRRYDGSQSNVDFIINGSFTSWDANHIGRGIPYLAVQLHYSTSAFPTGIPQITAVTNGALVYDPRLDSTNGGSGSQRSFNPATWTYSTNPALCLRDYLTSLLGLSETQARIDDVLVAAAASICDSTVTVPIPILPGLTNWTNGSAIVGGINTLFLRDLNNGNFTFSGGNYTPTVTTYVLAPNGSMLQVISAQSDIQLTLTANYTGSTIGSQVTQWNNSTATSTTQNRYTCSTVLDATARFESNVQTLAVAMMGRCIYSGGKWRMYAGAWSGFSFALTEEDLVGTVNIQCNTPRQDMWNAVRGNFTDPSQNYQPNEFPAILNSSYESQDGERIYTETSFACCTSTFEAQRNGIVISRQSRNRHIVTAQYGMSAYRVRVWETGTVTIAEVGWIAQSVRCIGWKFSQNGVIELTLQEAYSADWTDPILADYTIRASNIANQALDYIPYPPTGLTITQVAGGLHFDVVLPSQVIPGITIELWEFTASTPFSSSTLIWFGTSTKITIFKQDIVTRYYWTRTRSPSGIVSSTFPLTTGVSGAALSPVDSVWMPWVSTGTCAVSDEHAIKSAGATAWDSCVYSVKGYKSCHIVAKTNSTSDIAMFGLSTTPLASSSFTNMNVGWYNQAGTWHIYESGTDIGAIATVQITDVPRLIYDGSNVVYTLNNNVVRTVGAGTGTTFYGFCPFNLPGSVLNSLQFGASTDFSINDTAQIGFNAATTVASGSISLSIALGVIVDFASAVIVIPGGETWNVNITGIMTVFLGSAAAGGCRLRQNGITIQDTGGWGRASDAFITLNLPFTFVVSLTSGTYTFSVAAFNTSGGATHNYSAISISVLKR